MDASIVAEIAAALERLEAHPYLLGTANAWGDALSDEAVLEMLKAWNGGNFDFRLIASTGDIPPA